MHSLFPFAQLQVRFRQPCTLHQCGKAEYTKIANIEKSSITGLALNAWNRLVQVYEADVDPMAISQYIDATDEGAVDVDIAIVRGIEKCISAELIRDISYSCVTAEGESDPIAQLLVAHVYPNDIHIADVLFRDPSRPIPESEREFVYREFHGFGLLPQVMQSIVDFAKQRDCNFITLTAAAPDLVPLFARHGFVLETNPLGRNARAMERRLP